MVSAPLRLPPAVGEKVTLIVHDPDNGTGVAVQLSVSAKSPVGVTAETVIGLAPVLVTVTD